MRSPVLHAACVLRLGMQQGTHLNERTIYQILNALSAHDPTTETVFQLVVESLLWGDGSVLGINANAVVVVLLLVAACS